MELNREPPSREATVLTTTSACCPPKKATRDRAQCCVTVRLSAVQIIRAAATVAVKHDECGSVRVEAFPAAPLHTMSESGTVAGAVMLIHCDIPLIFKWRRSHFLFTHSQPPVIKQHGTGMQYQGKVTVCVRVCVCTCAVEVLKAH